MTQPPYGSGSDRPQDRPPDRPHDPTRPFPTYGRPTEPHAQQTGAAGSSWAAPGQPPYAQSQYGPGASQGQAPYGQAGQPQHGQAGQPPYGHGAPGHGAPGYGAPGYGAQTPYGPGYGPGQYPSQYGQPPAAYGYGYGYPGQGGTNGLATAALVCGLGGLVIGISAPVAIGLGIAALVQIGRRQQAGKGMAIAGLVIGSLVTIGYVLLFGLVIAFGSSADDDYGAPDQAPSSSSGSTTYIDELLVGECFDIDGASEEDEVVRQPCPDAHDAELVAIVTLPAGSYPNDNAMNTAADRACSPAFGTYVGKPSDQSELFLDWWTPGKSAWDQGDRRVLCAAFGPDDEKITGTVKNSRR